MIMAHRQLRFYALQQRHSCFRIDGRNMTAVRETWWQLCLMVDLACDCLRIRRGIQRFATEFRADSQANSTGWQVEQLTRDLGVYLCQAGLEFIDGARRDRIIQGLVGVTATKDKGAIF